MKPASFFRNVPRLIRAGKPLIDSPFTTRVPFPLGSRRHRSVVPRGERSDLDRGRDLHVSFGPDGGAAIDLHEGATLAPVRHPTTR